MDLFVRKVANLKIMFSVHNNEYGISPGADPGGGRGPGPPLDPRF